MNTVRRNNNAVRRNNSRRMDRINGVRVIDFWLRKAIGSV